MANNIAPAAGPQQFKDRTVIVSGAAGKLGRVICKALCDSGANVVANDIEADAVTDLVSSLKSNGASVHGITLSATSGEQIVSETLERFGAVHAVINAVMGPPPWTKFDETTDAAFRDAFESNVLGPLSLARAAWPHFRRQRFGRVVNFTSDSMLGWPTASSYTFSKGALLGVNKTLAMEGAPFNIKCNCVSPIAYLPHMDRHILAFSEDVQEAFRTRYTPEANVPMILALVSEECKASGDVFTTSGWAVGRCVLGYVAGESEMGTVNECLAKVDGLCEKGPREVFEPTSMVDFTEWQAKYVLGK
jgi:NAD(P)-dependent dehydrogenase (short-subunit alcohol dehydrogenase family)